MTREDNWPTLELSAMASWRHGMSVCVCVFSPGDEIYFRKEKGRQDMMNVCGVMSVGNDGSGWEGRGRKTEGLKSERQIP